MPWWREAAGDNQHTCAPFSPWSLRRPGLAYFRLKPPPFWAGDASRVARRPRTYRVTGLAHLRRIGTEYGFSNRPGLPRRCRIRAGQALRGLAGLPAGLNREAPWL